VSRRVLLALIGLVVVVLAALEVPLGVQNARTERRDLEARVERDAVSLASLAQTALRTGSARQLQAVAAIAYRYRRDTGGRVVIVDRRGVAVIDTNPAGRGAESFGSRPEIKTALRGVVASGTRHSNTLNTSLLYVAVPVASGGRLDGAVRITYPTSAIDARIVRYWLILAAIAGVALGVTALVGIRLASFAVRPLRRVEAAAAAVAGGDLSARAPEEGPDEVRSLATVFNDMVARVEQLLRSQQEFVDDASHQLRTPLTALRLRLENLERDVAALGKPGLEGAVREVERLSGLVDSLLALARADAGPIAAERLDVGRLVLERVDAWSALATERRVRLIAEPVDHLTARATGARVAQVLDNLIDNALDVSPGGSEIRVGARQSGGWIELHVRDQGPGLSDEDRQRAFDRFWRAGRGEGTGLGLAIARTLATADGGQVELLAADGGGLDAVVRLRPDRR
jgi:signal transduction histidine kinase